MSPNLNVFYFLLFIYSNVENVHMMEMQRVESVSMLFRYFPTQSHHTINSAKYKKSFLYIRMYVRYDTSIQFASILLHESVSNTEIHLYIFIFDEIQHIGGYMVQHFSLIIVS